MIAFFDVDGTLVDFSCRMPESTKKALTMLHHHGHKLVVSTGRSKSEVYPWLLDMEWDGLICGAGAYVEWQGEEIFARYMPDAMVKTIAEYLEARSGTYILEGSTHIWEKESLKEKNRALIEKWIKASNGDGNNQPIPKAKLFENIGDVHHIHKLNFHGMDMDVTQMENEINSLLKEQGLSEIKAIKFNNGNVYTTSGEITMVGVHKSLGIDMIMEKAGFDKKESIAFGDSLNDYEMVQGAGIGVAMGNACDALKEVADYVTTHINEDGIYNAVIKLGL